MQPGIQLSPLGLLPCGVVAVPQAVLESQFQAKAARKGRRGWKQRELRLPDQLPAAFSLPACLARLPGPPDPVPGVIKALRQVAEVPEAAVFERAAKQGALRYFSG